MLQTERRYNRLVKEGFPYWEAKHYTGIKLSDPSLMELRKERRATLRISRKEGVSKRSVIEQISAFYISEGLVKNRRYQPELLLQRYQPPPPRAERRAKEREEKEKQRIEDRATRRRYDILRDAYFTEKEAKILAAMEHIKPQNRDRVFNSDTWQAMRDTRIALVRKWFKKGFSMRKIKRMLDNYYRLPKRDPYDFLKREYRPKLKPKKYQARQQRRAEIKTDVVYNPKRVREHSKERKREVVLVWR